MPYSCQTEEAPSSLSARTAPSTARRTATSLGQFALVGGLCFLVGNGLMLVLVSGLGVHYLVALALCSILSWALSFGLNRRFAFAERASSFWRELGRYFLVNCGSLALNMALMAFLVSGLHVHYFVACVGLSVSMALFNFAAHRQWSFRAR